MKKNTKYLLLISLFIIVILLIFFILNFNNVSKKQIISLVEESKKITNYSSRYIGFSDTIYTIKVKDNILTILSQKNDNGNTNDNTISYYWSDSNTKEEILIKENTVLLNNKINDISRTKIPLTIDSFLNESEYKYLNAKKSGDKISVFVKDLSDNSKTELVINKDNGILLSITDKGITTTPDIKLDSVTDQDIKKPDVTGFNVIE